MPSLCRGLALGENGVISFVGAGGKTSLMFRLARELSAAGETVLTTTTTKMFCPERDQSEHLIVSASPKTILDEATRRLEESTHITAAAHRAADEKKLIGFAPESIAVLKASGRFRWILVEADGSKRLPLKAPAAHEPVVPDCTNVVIGILGLGAFGKPLDPRFVHRPDRVSKITGLRMGMNIGGDAFCRLLSHRNGIFQGTPIGARQIAFLNQADLPGMTQAGRAILQGLVRRKTGTLSHVVLGSAVSEPPIREYHELNRP